MPPSRPPYNTSMENDIESEIPPLWSEARKVRPSNIVTTPAIASGIELDSAAMISVDDLAEANDLFSPGLIVIRANTRPIQPQDSASADSEAK